MSFDEEHRSVHDECAHEIATLRAHLAELAKTNERQLARALEARDETEAARVEREKVGELWAKDSARGE